MAFRRSHYSTTTLAFQLREEKAISASDLKTAKSNQYGRITIHSVVNISTRDNYWWILLSLNFQLEKETKGFDLA